LITYLLPIVSARAVPQQIDFFNTHSKNFVLNALILLINLVGELEKFTA